MKSCCILKGLKETIEYSSFAVDGTEYWGRRSSCCPPVSSGKRDRNESKLDECVLQQSVSQIGLDLQIHDRVIVQELQEFGSLWFLLQDLQQM